MSSRSRDSSSVYTKERKSVLVCFRTVGNRPGVPRAGPHTRSPTRAPVKVRKHRILGFRGRAFSGVEGGHGRATTTTGTPLTSPLWPPTTCSGFCASDRPVGPTTRAVTSASAVYTCSGGRSSCGSRLTTRGSLSVVGSSSLSGTSAQTREGSTGVDWSTTSSTFLDPVIDRVPSTSDL